MNMLTEKQKAILDDLQARLEILGVVDVKFYRGEKFHTTPVDDIIAEMVTMVEAAEDTSKRTLISPKPIE